jgi:hypothetical protein
MQYALLTYLNQDSWTSLTKEENQRRGAAYKSFYEALASSGVLVGNHGLSAAATATTVRVENGKPQVLDGPYADTKEQLGGIFIIDVADLDAALAWARRCPAADHGAVEVRPLWGQR